MPDPKVIERVQKLIALAGSDNENEARNAAFIAVKLIREHKLTFVEEDSFEAFQRTFNERRAARREPPPARPAPTWTPPSRPRPREDLSDADVADIFKDFV